MNYRRLSGSNGRKPAPAAKNNDEDGCEESTGGRQAPVYLVYAFVLADLWECPYGDYHSLHTQTLNTPIMTFS